MTVYGDIYISNEILESGKTALLGSVQKKEVEANAKAKINPRIKIAVNKRRNFIHNMHPEYTYRKIESNLYAGLWRLFNVTSTGEITGNLVDIAVRFIKGFKPPIKIKR